MIIIDGTKEIEYDGMTKIAIGKFDGIHLGHQRLIGEMVSEHDGLRSLVFTFTKESEPFLKDSGRILTKAERRKKFEALGVDYLVEFELNETTAKTEPEDFARDILRERLHCKKLFCGPDLSFGYKGRGDVALLKSMESELGIEVKVVEKLQYKGADISSTRIRTAIKSGNDEDAEYMLGSNKRP
ncbi:MAG: hypothetical protein K5796_06790 [Lachnospiraceae bacterium]|nr:hypothetical protein [Lachnospiraceae bacterium]